MTTRRIRITLLSLLAIAGAGVSAQEQRSPQLVSEWPAREIKAGGDCARITMQAVKHLWPKLMDDDRGLPARLPMADRSLVPRIVKAPLMGAVIGGKRVGSHAQRVYVRMLDYPTRRLPPWAPRECDLGNAYVVLPDLGNDPVVLGPVADRPLQADASACSQRENALSAAVGTRDCRRVSQ